MEIDPLELQHRTEAALRTLHGLQAEIRLEIRNASPALRQEWHRLGPELGAALQRGYEPDPETCRALDEVLAHFRQFLARLRQEAALSA